MNDEDLTQAIAKAEIDLLKRRSGDTTLRQILYRYCPSNVAYVDWLQSLTNIIIESQYRIGNDILPPDNGIDKKIEEMCFSAQPTHIQHAIVHRFFKREWYSRHVDYIRETEWLIQDSRLLRSILRMNYYNWLLSQIERVK